MHYGLRIKYTPKDVGEWCLPWVTHFSTRLETFYKTTIYNELMYLCFFIIVAHSIMSFPNEVDYTINSHHNGWPRTAVAAKGADYQSSLGAPADQIKYESPTTQSVRSPSASSAETRHYSRNAALRRRLRDR